MSTTTKTVGSRKSHQSLEQSAGAPEPSDPDAYYCVTPGETAAEYFPANLKGQSGAIKRAAWLSVAQPPQRVLATRSKARYCLQPCQDKVISRFRGGQEIWSAASTTPDPGDDPPGGLTLALHAI